MQPSKGTTQWHTYTNRVLHNKAETCSSASACMHDLEIGTKCRCVLPTVP